MERIHEMELTAFETLKAKFRQADTDTKISLYVDAEDLSQTQYRELLHLFPRKELGRLEAALS